MQPPRTLLLSSSAQQDYRNLSIFGLQLFYHVENSLRFLPKLSAEEEEEKDEEAEVKEEEGEAESARHVTG